MVQIYREIISKNAIIFFYILFNKCLTKASWTK